MDPDNISDPKLGELRWDSRFDWWEGRFPQGSETSFQLYIKGQNADRTISAEAHQAVALLAERDASIRRWAADGLLEILNSTWNEGDPIDADEFIRRMSPDGIVVYASGRADVSYHDNDMFLGHAISVRIAPDGTFIESLIEG
jgi:hypothetical protein